MDGDTASGVSPRIQTAPPSRRTPRGRLTRWRIVWSLTLGVLLPACASGLDVEQDVAFDRVGIERHRFEVDLDEAIFRVVISGDAQPILVNGTRDMIPDRGRVVEEMRSLGYTPIPAAGAAQWQIYPRWKATPIELQPRSAPAE